MEKTRECGLRKMYKEKPDLPCQGACDNIMRGIKDYEIRKICRECEKLAEEFMQKGFEDEDTDPIS